MKRIKTFSKAPIARIKKNTNLRLLDNVVIEQPIFLSVNDKQLITILATPTNLEALAVGNLFSLGFIETYNDITSIKFDPKKDFLLKIKIKKLKKPINFSKVIINSSQGASNILTEFKDKKTKIKLVKNNLKITTKKLFLLAKELQKLQTIFPKTGATHAALLFDQSGKKIAFAEDVGRHNALDKVIGQCLIENKKPGGLGLILSSRVSFEMLTKAARAKIEIVAAVSAPTNLAIALAKQWRLTLCGFVRKEKMNIYTHEERFIDLK